ncbi:hypothetical protein ABES80_13330 [Bacillus gobiensis]|uniref:hypothetical protein n=1 Tax=Bacillus gobiensis TaxID=1441095 RepID=UPI003D1D15E5
MAGQLVTVFALAYAIGPPILVTLTARINRKKVMLSALFLFIIGNLVALWTPNGVGVSILWKHQKLQQEKDSF